MPLLGPDAELTEQILGCAFRVHAVLGSGFLEMVYEKAPLHELRKAGKGIDEAHIAQTLHYLKATGLKTALLLNFGVRSLEVKRLLF